ncbi:phosphotransferase family protein [Flavobacteriaceae bacterium F89]|uniref:Phosphotransferase family protein n=1 Tax=Cerina litoralis TaxID=2874477 RepID=A0AAE3ETZ0_9FLAO|nr:phosphotransferase family protein [Cerina litoralis]MCG2459731.1 phosphotransferase family protein [Cerina litoralis]
MPERVKTKAVRKGEELNEGNLKKFLMAEGLIGDIKSELIVGQFSNGYSNLTYLLRIDKKEFVLRRPPFSAPKRGHDMGREFKVLHNLHKVFGKTPMAYVHSADEKILGAPFYIMEFVNGIILTAKEARERNITPSEFGTIADTWLDAFVELHQVDYKAAGLESLGRPKGYVSRQVINWGKQYLAAATDNVPTAHNVMSWMEKNQPGHYQYSLIHNDYKYDNIVFSDGQWKKVAAILDWEMCTLGDPLMDLGTSLGYWTTGEDAEFIRNGLPSPTVMAGNPSRMEIVQQYAVKSGRNIDNLTFYFVYGLFKIAVIAQQIYYRFKHGHTTDPRFAQLNRVSALCCNTAWQAIQKNQIDKLY